MPMTTPNTRSCDVLVAGSGLAGLRAGISTLEENPRLQVVLVTRSQGPSGSSFTNRNNRLGMVVCQNDEEAAAFTRTAAAIAPPGIIHPGLPALMARESASLFHDLVNTGFRFIRDSRGHVERHPCCFLREPCLASVFTDLAQAFDAMSRRFLAAGGILVQGYTLKDLVPGDKGSIQGAMFEEEATGVNLAVQAKALVLASGGSTGLFSRHLTAGENLGFATALMGRRGIPLVNMPFVQHLWYETKTLAHWPCWTMADPLVLIGSPDGKSGPVPDEIRDLCGERSRHVPMAHGRSDSAIDRFLLSRLHDDGTVRIFSPDKGWFTVAPFAHAMNGGVEIDETGETMMKGLSACGECAGGMHGANRIGGAMVLATQVFGSRAGVHAARHAEGRHQKPPGLFMASVKDRLALIRRDEGEWVKGLSLIRKTLTTLSGPFPMTGRRAAADTLRRIQARSTDWRLDLAVETALMITGDIEQLLIKKSAF